MTRRLLFGLAVIFLPAGCTATASPMPSQASPTEIALPGDPGTLPVPAGARVLRIEVRNERDQPATLYVAVPDPRQTEEPPVPDRAPDKMPALAKLVGAAQPSIVPANRRTDVVFLVPPTGDWWIFANGFPLISSSDRDDLAGARSVWIELRAGEDFGGWGFSSE